LVAATGGFDLQSFVREHQVQLEWVQFNDRTLACQAESTDSINAIRSVDEPDRSLNSGP
jgi:hypothetical protein